MSNISGLLGTAGGYKGTGVAAPDESVSAGQLAAAQTGVNTGMAGQNSLLTALQGQNGLANQTQNYNQLQGVINGTGPNPAQAQLAQATGANTANQAALMADQRGSSQNAGLIARQAAMQGGANQQQSAGQAATLQAQQSLNAIGQAGGMANTMASNQIGQTNTNEQAAQAQQSALLNANSQQNQVNQQLISGTAAQQAAIGGGGMSGAGSAMSSMAAEGGEVSDLPVGSPPAADQSAYKGASKFGKFLSQASSGAGAPTTNANGEQDLYKGASNLGKGIGQYFASPTNSPDQTDAQAKAGYTQANQYLGSHNTEISMPADNNDMQFARGGKVPALVSPGEIRIHAKDVKKVAAGKKSPLSGEKLAPHVKPKIGGAKNSYANDTIPKNLNEGDIILPRSVTQSKNPHWAAHKFVSAIMAKNQGKKK
jgi:hypothetical protein